MGKSLSDKIKELPLERQKKIEARAQELIAQEMYRNRTRQVMYIMRKPGVFSKQEVAVLRRNKGQVLV
ncbi:hypothetical protein H6G76_24055 [Nostoc sp. FACHB-152]|uniref:hypothetical protein n=1 Tax=unclassified Nostoc TaxID=2593658 RepID=UPI001689F8C5|nr:MULTISPECIES: hypothetical protein [unclassified Nostoc]MBD2450177.1 hypothetical protein [Nostoc sp. FACHB-152]MBD2469000.1 hypothetical protein [Nostoc sp. FACHB-145]